MTLDLLATPHIFSQYGPLTSREFIRQAKRYRLPLDAAVLQRMHERGELSPLAVITDTPVADPMAPIQEPVVPDTLWSELRQAQAEGRIFDPAALAGPDGPAAVEFREARIEDPRGWSNGLIYSRWQFLDAPWLRRRASLSPAAAQAESPDVAALHRERGAELRRLALAATVLEAPYLPRVRPDLVHLRNFDADEWHLWVATYDPLEQHAALDLTEDELARLAESVLRRASSIDPSGPWKRLIARASARSWEQLEGDLAAALDLRVAAEILLLSLESTGHRTGSGPLTTPSSVRTYDPLIDRLSSREEPLDRVLSRLGVSPHPGAMLLIEGETERRHIRLILEHLYSVDTAHLIRVVTMDGVNHGLDLVAVATAAPLLGERRRDHYEMIRPPCQVIVAVDPDRGWATEAQAETKRSRLVAALVRAVEAQAPDADTRELDYLVEVVRWEECCYEFAHFSDLELLEAVTTVHERPASRPGDNVILDQLAEARRRGLDIKHVWHDWDFQPPKPDLADALWPFLRGRIDEASATQSEQPHVVEVILAAFETALGFSQGTWSLPVRD